MKKGDKLYYARILESVGMFEVIDLKIRTVEDTWFVGVDNRTKQSFLFGTKCLNNSVFLQRDEALQKVKNAEKHCKRRFSDEKYYEEY